MIKTMQLLHTKEPMWTRHASKMLSLPSGQMDQQVVTSCVIIQQSNHGWNRTTVDKLCHVYQSEGGGVVSFFKRCFVYFISSILCYEGWYIIQTDIKDVRRKTSPVREGWGQDFSVMMSSTVLYLLSPSSTS